MVHLAEFFDLEVFVVEIVRLFHGFGFGDGGVAVGVVVCFLLLRQLLLTTIIRTHLSLIRSHRILTPRPLRKMSHRLQLPLYRLLTKTLLNIQFWHIIFTQIRNFPHGPFQFVSSRSNNLLWRQTSNVFINNGVNFFSSEAIRHFMSSMRMDQQKRQTTANRQIFSDNIAIIRIIPKPRNQPLNLILQQFSNMWRQ